VTPKKPAKSSTPLGIVLSEDARAGSLAEHRLFDLVKKVTNAKTGKYLYSCGEVAKDSDDHSQEVAIRVWEQIGTFKGKPENFYPWLHKICHRAACDAYEETKAFTALHVPLMVEVEDEEGKTELVDEPEMLRTSGEARQFTVAFDLSERQRGDTAAQVSLIACGRQWGVLSANDGRRILGLPAGGVEDDELMVPVNMMSPARLTNPPKPDPAETVVQDA
jgi:DNA-directed RNA polymerase specialized sigma24 family protein